ncbi:MAG: hypothetical protein KG003_12140 [Bacteroidetes bacterium]|nr:hypothetical protein [Bacteroidota bacterium]
MNKYKLFSYSFIILLAACSQPQNSNDNQQITDSVQNDKDSEITVPPKNNSEDVPPFSDTCACSFDIIGDIRISPTHMERIISGIGWNPQSHSCSWTWGELIANALPPDSLITVFKIHLVELPKSNITLNPEFIQSNAFKSSLIATNTTKGMRESLCIFDPFKTGKYPKPKYWE